MRSNSPGLRRVNIDADGMRTFDAMNDLFQGPAADFDHPIEILEGCHQRIRRNCNLVARIGRHLVEKGADEEARQAAAAVIRYFDEAGRHHHLDEEEDLFPALQRLATGRDEALVAALLERLLREHDELEGQWQAMRARLEAVTRGEPVEIAEALAEAFARGYERHIEIEEATLFPLVRRVLDAAALAALGESMAARRGVKRARPPAG